MTLSWSSTRDALLAAAASALGTDRPAAFTLAASLTAAGSAYDTAVASGTVPVLATTGDVTSAHRAEALRATLRAARAVEAMVGATPWLPGDAFALSDASGGTARVILDASGSDAGTDPPFVTVTAGAPGAWWNTLAVRFNADATLSLFVGAETSERLRFALPSVPSFEHRPTASFGTLEDVVGAAGVVRVRYHRAPTSTPFVGWSPVALRDGSGGASWASVRVRALAALYKIRGEPVTNVTPAWTYPTLGTADAVRVARLLDVIAWGDSLHATDGGLDGLTPSAATGAVTAMQTVEQTLVTELARANAMLAYLAAATP